MKFGMLKGKVAASVIIGATIIIAVGMGVVHILKGLRYATTDDAYVTGRVHQVAAKIPGTVQKVWVADNQSVKQGELLLEIDPADYAVKVREAEAAAQAEGAKYEEAIAKAAAAETNLEVQAINVRQAEIDLRRAERLFTNGVYPKEKLEKAQTAAALARSQVKAAKEQIREAKASRELEAALVDQRQAALASAKLNLGYAKLPAPASGVVTRKSVENGNQVQAGQPLLAVVALEEVWVVANYKETQLKDMHSGQSALIAVDTYPGHLFRGKVDSIMAGTGAAFTLFPSENALGNYVKVVQRIPVKIVLEEGQDPEHLLRVGMSVVAKVRIKE